MALSLKSESNPFNINLNSNNNDKPNNQDVKSFKSG